jgi:hypothetical protein
MAYKVLTTWKVATIKIHRDASCSVEIFLFGTLPWKCDSTLGLHEQKSLACILPAGIFKFSQ